MNRAVEAFAGLEWDNDLIDFVAIYPNPKFISLLNPLSPPSDPVQRRLQSPPAKSNFLAVDVDFEVAVEGEHNGRSGEGFEEFGEKSDLVA